MNNKEGRTIAAERCAELEIRKLADTKYPIEDVLRRRCSTMAFADRPVEVEKLQRLFEAARWAPSSYNEQPWSFLLTTKSEVPKDYDLLLNCIASSNRKWAQRAPVLILTVAKRHLDAGRGINHYALHDVGLAVGNLTIEATALGLFTHLIAGFDRTEARKVFAIPDTHEPVSVIATGYFGDFETLSPETQQKELAPRQRRPFRESVFSGRWGNASELIPD